MEEPSSRGSSMVSLIHRVRKMLLESDSAPVDSEREVEVIVGRLLNLESYFDGYDDVEIVRQLKDSIAKHVLSPDMGTDNALSDVEDCGDVSVHGFRNGLGPIRKAFLRELTESVGGVTQEMIESNAFFEAGSTSSKKQKAGGSLFSSFNFDDLQGFEPLEVILRKLRDDPNSHEGIEKLMTIDAAELVEHSQWPEVVELMDRALVKAENDNDKLDILVLHIRFMHSLHGQQSIDISTNLLRYFWRKWGWWQTRPSPDHIVGPSSHADNTITFSNVERMEMACFCSLIECCRSNLEHCTDASAESVVIVLFLVMASGYVPTHLGAVGVEQGSLYLHVLDAIALSKCEGLITKCMEVSMCIKPVSAAIYAVNSTLVKTVINRLQGRSEAVLSNKECSNWQFKSEILDLGLILNFFAPLEPFNGENLFNKALCGDPSWLWDGTEHSGDEAHRGATSNEGLPRSYSLPLFNKVFHQLSGSQAMVGEEEATEGDVPFLSSAASGEKQMGQFFHIASELMFACMALASKGTLSNHTQTLYRLQSLLLFITVRSDSHEVLFLSWRACCDHIARCREEGNAIFEAYLSALQSLFNLKVDVPTLAPLIKLWVEITSSGYASSTLRGDHGSFASRSCLFSSWEKLLSVFSDQFSREPDASARSGDPFGNNECLGCIQMLTERALDGQYGKVLSGSTDPIPLFLARVATTPASVQARVLSEDLWHRLTVDMIAYLIDFCEGTDPWNVFHRGLVMKGVLAVLLRPGQREMPDSTFGRIVECLKRESNSVDIFESSFSQDCSSPFTLLLYLLITASSFGHATLALRIMRAAFAPLDEFMKSNTIESPAELIVCLVEDKYALSCEPINPALLRVMDAALSNPDIASEVATLLRGRGVEAEDEGLGIEEIFTRAVGTKVLQIAQENKSPFIQFDPQKQVSVPLLTPLGFLKN